MRIHLKRARARWSFAIAVVFVAAGFCFLAGRVWLAEHWSASDNPQLWLRAAELEPGNADYWQHLGLYAQLDLQHRDVGQAVAYLERAASINPRSDEIWTDLASAYEQLGRPAEARKAYQKAQADHPISGEIAWRYGSFLVRQGDLVGGFAQIRRALLVEPSLTTSAIAECWEASGDAASVVHEALPATSSYYLTALNYFLSQKQDAAAIVVWKGLLNLGQPIGMDQAMHVVNQLIGENRISDAEIAWREALQAAHWPHEASDGDSAVFNGGFEHVVANGGFDWREEPAPGAGYALDRATAHSGVQSMRVTFDGTSNLDFAQLMQYVPVEAKKEYRFRAYLRTEGITTDSGMRFFIYDASHPAEVPILTPNITGSNPWTQVESDVATGPDTTLLVIALRRVPSWKFDNKLAGTVWIDDVSLVPVEKAALKGKSK